MPGLSRPVPGSLLALPALAVSLLFGLAAYASPIHGGASSDRSSSSRPRGASEGVRLGGHAVGLYPGSAQRLRVHVDNLGRQAVTVRSIQALVGSPTRRCSAASVSVSSYRGDFRLRPRRRRWVPLTISMRPDAANACRHARFPLTYLAKVTR